MENIENQETKDPIIHENYNHVYYKVKKEDSDNFSKLVINKTRYLKFESLEELQAQEYSERVLGMNFIDSLSDKNVGDMMKISGLREVILSEIQESEDYKNIIETVCDRSKKTWREANAIVRLEEEV